MKEILLIGNGPSATDYTMGKAIDTFPYVARFNTFRIHGYQEYVGTKCDVWIACDNFPQWQGYYDYKEVFYVSPVRDRPNPKFDRFKQDMPDAKVFPAWAWNDVSKMMKSHPSSGAIAAYYFSKLYDRVYLYGFDCFQATRHHYGDDLAHCHHKAENERAFINKLLKEGVVKEFNNYTVLHDHNPGYGVGGAFAENILSFKPRSVLDYGCGKGRLVKHLRTKGIPAEGYDPYVFEFRNRPEPQDMLVSTDVLEHIEKNELDTVLSDMQSYQPRLMFHVISNRPAVQILPDDSNAHKIVEPPDWWLDKLKSAFPDYETKIYKYNDKQNFTVYVMERCMD